MSDHLQLSPESKNKLDNLCSRISTQITDFVRNTNIENIISPNTNYPRSIESIKNTIEIFEDLFEIYKRKSKFCVIIRNKYFSYLLKVIRSITNDKLLELLFYKLGELNTGNESFMDSDIYQKYILVLN